MEKNSYAGGVTRFTKTLLDILFYLCAAATLSLPWTMRWAVRFYPSISDCYALHVILFMLSGAGATVIVWELRRMLETVLKNDCFVHENVRSLRRMGCIAIGIAAVNALRLIVLFTPATLLIIGVFLLAGLFSFVLSQVFDRAVRYKEENDLTI